MGDISVIELKKRLDAGEKLILIDVREPFEYEAYHLESDHIPLGDLMAKLDDLTDYKNKEIILICRSGNRSGSAAVYMQGFGFAKARNMAGGMRAWQEQIDPTISVL